MARSAPARLTLASSTPARHGARASFWALERTLDEKMLA